MVRALRTTPAGAVDLRCNASNVPRTAAVNTIFQELGLPRRRGAGCKQAPMACLCCSSPAETILFGIVSNTLPSCLTRSVWLNAPRSLPDESYSSPSPGDRAMPGILHPIYVDLY